MLDVSIDYSDLIKEQTNTTLSKFLYGLFSDYKLQQNITKLNNGLLFIIESEFKRAFIVVFDDSTCRIKLEYNNDKYFKLYQNATIPFAEECKTAKYNDVKRYFSYALSFVFPEKYKHYFAHDCDELVNSCKLNYFKQRLNARSCYFYF